MEGHSYREMIFSCEFDRADFSCINTRRLELGETVIKLRNPYDLRDEEGDRIYSLYLELLSPKFELDFYPHIKIKGFLLEGGWYEEEILEAMKVKAKPPYWSDFRFTPENVVEHNKKVVEISIAPV
ncbi:MAG: hypothetical protein KDH96_11765 [Candidatus Riesia sp.]|nr:hypothetical protein [Candidatus Riesia sp.]